MPAVYRSIPFAFESQSFGALLRQRRESAGLSQREVGELINRSDSFIGALERNQQVTLMSITDYINLCNLLDLNPSAFFLLSEDCNCG